MTDLPWIITVITKDGRTVNYIQYDRFGPRRIISAEKADELIENGEAQVLTTEYP